MNKFHGGVEAIPTFATFPPSSSTQASLDLLKDSDHQDRKGLHAASRHVADWAVKLQRTAALRRLALTSIGGGAADSALAAVAIARAIAAKGARTVVVDLASEGSSIDTLFGLPSGPGFVDLLAGTTDFTKVIARDPLSNAHLLRFGLERNEAIMSLMDQRTDAVLSALGNIYDVVLIHTGEASSRATMLIVKCQAALLLAPDIRQDDVAKTAKSLIVSGLTDVQFVRLESMRSGEDRARRPLKPIPRKSKIVNGAGLLTCLPCLSRPVAGQKAFGRNCALPQWILMNSH